MPRLTFDNQAVDVPEGTTILQAAARLGIVIPTLCHRRGLAPQTSCFVCVVKVQGRDALAPSCATPVQDGMVVQSDCPEVLQARRTCLELLMSDHVGDCIAPCQSVCPLGANVPGLLRQIASGDMHAALASATVALVLPAVLGRLCGAPCEKACRRSHHDAAVPIRLLHRFIADMDLAHDRRFVPACPRPNGRKVAIVGTGPAGLATAFHMRRRGYDCCLIDAQDVAGGMLRIEANHRRLPVDVLDSEIRTIAQMGAQFQLGAALGVDVTLDDLLRQYNAVVIATGPLQQGQADLWGLSAGDEGLLVDSASRQTSRRGVFAAGDVIQRRRITVRSVAEGAAVAAAVDAWLTGATGLPAKPFSCHMGAMKEGEVQAMLALASADWRQEPKGPPGAGFTASQAKREALRCLHCDCRRADDCRLREHCQALGAGWHKYGNARRSFEQNIEHAGIIFEPGKCIRCGLCIQAAAAHGEKTGLAWSGRGYDTRVVAPFERSLAEAFEVCADACVAVCPTGALAHR